MSICDSRLLDSNFQEISFPSVNGEEFRYVLDSDHLYCVSDFGRVFSRLGGRGTIKNEWHELTRQLSMDKYWFVTISRRGKPDPMKTHILVLESFISRRPEGMLGLHKDDCRLNSVRTNLYWGSYVDNANDRIKNKKLMGEGHGMAKLTDDSVLRIRELRKFGLKNIDIQAKIEQEYGIKVDVSMISHAATGRTWKHLEQNKDGHRNNHKGENNGATIATTEQVIRARELRRQGMSFADIHRNINKEFNVDLPYSCVHQFTKGKSWKHLET
jgi:hypothetical protein